MFEDKEKINLIKQANRNDVIRAIVILLIELDGKYDDNSLLRNIDLFDVKTKNGLINQFWNTYNLYKSGFMYPCSSTLHLKKSRDILVSANFQIKTTSGLYKTTPLGTKVIEYLKARYIQKVTGLTVSLNVKEEIVDSFIKIACFFLHVNSDGVLRDPHSAPYKVYNHDDNTWNLNVVSLALKDFEEYIEW